MPNFGEMTQLLEEQIEAARQAAVAAGTDPQLAVAQAATTFLVNELNKELQKVSLLRGDSHVILYGSGWFQKGGGPGLAITAEDLNGFMNCIHGSTARKATLILHTPGGELNAATSIVEYLRSKFDSFEVIVPTFCMSAGTMIALSSSLVVMGRQSQLGPIDPQWSINGRSVGVQSILDEFASIQKAISTSPSPQAVAMSWMPILQQLHPGQVTEAGKVAKFAEECVATWLKTGMFAGQAHSSKQASKVAKFFSSSKVHKTHGRRIDRDAARKVGVKVEDLENSQDLQDAVLNGYHLMSMLFERTQLVRLIANHNKLLWAKASTK